MLQYLPGKMNFTEYPFIKGVFDGKCLFFVQNCKLSLSLGRSYIKQAPVQPASKIGERKCDQIGHG